MTYAPIPFRSFAGGLNLRDSPDVVSEAEAIDLLNVTFTKQGTVEQRDGYARRTALPLTNDADSIFPFYSSSDKILLIGNGGRVDAVTANGIVSTSTDDPTTGPHFFARFGGETREAVYLANGADQIRRYDTASGFTSPAGLSSIVGHYLTITPTSNRLVSARGNGSVAGNNPSTVGFSEPGDPETWLPNNYIDLDPGDGESIMGVCSWGDLTFIFKETKFWVHYSETVDTTGEPVFNVRKVDTGIGLVASKALTVGRDGVYFLAREGVYRTTGQGVELLSDKIDKFFVGDPEIYFEGRPLNHTYIAGSAGTWFEERFYLSVPTTNGANNDHLLVFDPLHGWWTLYDIPAQALCPFRIGSDTELVFVNGPHLYRHAPDFANDAMEPDGTGGVALDARWRSGWIDYGTMDVKTIRESILTGSGQLDLSLYKDWEEVPSPPIAVVLSGSDEELWQGTDFDLWGDGTDPADLWGDGTTDDLWGDGTAGDGDPGPKLWGDGTDPEALWGPTGSGITTRKARRAIRGRVFSTRLSNSTANTSFSVHRLVHHLRERRVPSVVGTERT